VGLFDGILKAASFGGFDPTGVPGLLGMGAVGSEPDKVKSSQEAGIRLGAMSPLEKMFGDSVDSDFSQLKTMGDLGPGTLDVSASLNSSRDLASMLGDYAKGGYQPNDSDISSSNDLATKLFGSRQTALNQSFQDQTTEANRLAARLGRSVDDPILQAKLRSGMMRQQDSLNSDKQGWATQYALNQPMQRLNFAGQKANILSGLASQAMSNRNALLSMGSNLLSGERNFRLQQGTQWHTGEQESGGGLKGAISAGLGWMGTLGSGVGMMMGMPSMGGLGSGAAGLGSGAGAGAMAGMNFGSVGQMPQMAMPQMPISRPLSSYSDGYYPMGEGGNILNRMGKERY
jgi:hypothetical protein